MLTPNPVQTSYTRYLTVAEAGMPATTTGWDVSTRIAEDPSNPATGIGFGLAVSQGTLHGDRSACVGLLSGRAFVGITASDKTLANYAARPNPDVYVDGENMAVATRGDWWVVAHTTVHAGDAVYFNSSNGQLGGSGISNATLITGAIWITGQPVTGLMAVETGSFAIVRLGVTA